MQRLAGIVALVCLVFTSALVQAQTTHPPPNKAPTDESQVVNYEITHEMTWKYVKPKEEQPLSKTIVLKFVNFPKL